MSGCVGASGWVCMGGRVSGLYGGRGVRDWLKFMSRLRANFVSFRGTRRQARAALLRPRQPLSYLFPPRLHLSCMNPPPNCALQQGV